ncbi:Macrocin-O-methyltransferase TylF [Pseudomonas sp. 8BK]|uniref:TylF/MycF/NovP-related O-methyltransferase n=1 Tax=Pseudomonas sp. 8BK TaxID=2653164 RepID=UPI0012EF1254|nr:TylF/MycF/NovP-related O-methyltransferase [Pseudomonas sp. 8BK]VXC27889.1 Macrocin-O-methyltransferase TylF [Pseudomonas sp. 8BK]
MLTNFVNETCYGVTDGERFSQGVSDVLASVLPHGIFISDNLMTWNKSLTFLRDKAFMNTVLANEPTAVELSLVWRQHVLCWAARQCARLPGDYVEAGCYKGFSAKIICDYLGFAEHTDKNYYLYDAFEHAADMAHHAMPEHGEDLYSRVCARFSDYPNVRVIKGLVPESFAQGMPEKVAFMHVDMNNAFAEVAVLDALFDRLLPGGMIVFDDYGWLGYSPQQEAEDAWLAGRPERVLELPTGQGLLVKT